MKLLGLQRLHCRPIRRALLWDYVAERLSEGPLEAVERHLVHCASCRQEAESLRRAQGLLAACRQAPVPAPRSDWNTLRARIREERPMPLRGAVPAHLLPLSPLRHPQRWIARRSDRWMPSLLGSSACALLLLLSALGYRMLYAGVPSPVNPAVQAGAGSLLSSASGETNPHAPTQRMAFASTATPTANPFTEWNDGFNNGFNNGFNSGLWMNLHQADPATVRPVNTTRRQTDEEQPTISASLRAMRNRKSADRTPSVGSSRGRRKGGSGKLNFHPYKLRPQDAAPQVAEARHYPNASVVPLGTAGTGGAYIMPTLRPVQRDDESLY